MIFVVLIIVVLFIIFAMGKCGTGIHDIYKDLVLANNDNRLVISLFRITGFYFCPYLSYLLA